MHLVHYCFQFVLARLIPIHSKISICPTIANQWTTPNQILNFTMDEAVPLIQDDPSSRTSSAASAKSSADAVACRSGEVPLVEAFVSSLIECPLSSSLRPLVSVVVWVVHVVGRGVALNHPASLNRPARV